LKYTDKMVRSSEKQLAYAKKWQQENRDRWTLYKKKCIDNKPAKYLLLQTKHNAKDRSYEFNISEDDIKIPERCPVLKIPLTKLSNGGDYAPSVDRIDNSLGYTKDNIHVVSWRANHLRSNGTLEEFKKIVEWEEGRIGPPR
jgi:hypothetical protein